MSDLEADEMFMGEALRQAMRAYEAGEVPVGAVVVRGGKVIARAWNQVEMLKDATAHAEMLAAQGIIQAEGSPERLHGRLLEASVASRPGVCG